MPIPRLGLCIDMGPNEPDNKEDEDDDDAVKGRFGDGEVDWPAWLTVDRIDRGARLPEPEEPEKPEELMETPVPAEESETEG